MGESIRAQAVLRRLIDEQLDRHDAIHAIASILVNLLHEMMLLAAGRIATPDQALFLLITLCFAVSYWYIYWIK